MSDENKDEITAPTPDDIPSEVTIVGLRKSATLMLIYIIAFVGMCIVFVTALFSSPDITFKSIVAGALGLTSVGVVYGVVRYFAEQIIVYNAMNNHIMMKK
jgi:hypothetical protein